jgi:3-oxoacyl-[acyl-carrier protein] reductase
VSDLAERVAVITGGGGGIGRADALKLAAAGASIVLGDLDLARAEATAAAVRAAGGEAQAVRVDVADEADVEAFLERAAAWRGRVDVLVNNAGIFSSTPVVEMSLADWSRMLAIHLTGTFLCARAALRYMVPARRGAIVNMSSGLGYRGGAGVTHYATAKAGLVGFTRSLALEVGRHGIRVNAIAPGLVETDMPRNVLTEAEIKAQAERAPLGRNAEADDIADTVLFLVGDASRHITGQVLHVNGGGYFG